eukprot:scaffold7448_cov15-Prasinocladus_malaysianus.AAC.1
MAVVASHTENVSRAISFGFGKLASWESDMMERKSPVQSGDESQSKAACKDSPKVKTLHINKAEIKAT